MSGFSAKVLLLACVWSAGVWAQQPVQKSIELGDLDRTAAPCDDFYEFSNGTWRANHPIPASMDRWSRRWKAGEENKEQLKVILDDLSSKTDLAVGTPAQQTGDFYASCVNEKAIDAAGNSPIAPYLAEIDAIHDRAGLQAAIRDLQKVGLSVPFRFGGGQDPHDPTQIISDLGPSGLGLPDRDYYLKQEKRFAEARAGYLVYVAKLLVLSGVSQADAAKDAQIVMKMETELAKSSLDNVALRDPHASDHPTDLAGLKKAAPHVEWTALYASENVVPGKLNIEQPVFMTEVDRQFATEPLADWKVYLRWQFLNAFASYLPTSYVDAQFDFFSKQLDGVGELKPRATRCAEFADAFLGEALGQEYVKRYFPPAAKARAEEMVHNILGGMHDSVEAVDWMTPATKQRAFEKLATFQVKVGYPDKWKDYSSVRITRGRFFDDVIASSKFQVADDAKQIGKPVDRKRWGMTPPTSNAYYNSQMNEIVFPAGILQPPAFSLDNTDAANYGAIGVVIGHEISHGFDDQGAQFDAQGKLNNWWTPADLDKFHEKTGCVVKQFDGYTIDGAPDIHINGKLTLGESIGDLGGLKIAYLAFKKTPQGKSQEKIAGFTPDQQFFIAWGQFRGDETRPETQKLMVQGDPHPVAKYRVIGPMSNFAPFAAAFGCKAGDRMVRPPAEACVVW